MKTRKFPTLFGLLALLLALPALVYAHADLVSVVPEPGATLDAAPAEIRLTFSEPVGAGSSVVLLAEGFETVEGVSAAPVDDDARVLVAPLPALAEGEYTVQWTAVSADGHEISGSYGFSISAAGAGESEFWDRDLLVRGALIILAAMVVTRMVAGLRPRPPEETSPDEAPSDKTPEP